MKKILSVIAVTTLLPFASSAFSQDVNKLIESVDKDKATESVDTKKMTEAVSSD
jgi:hypothetical protein